MTTLLRQKIFVFLLDFLILVGSFVLAFYVRLGSFERTDFPFEFYLQNALLILPVWLFFLVWGGRYSLREHRFFEMLRIVVLSSITATMLFVLIFFFRREIFFSRLIVLSISAFGVFFLMAVYILEYAWNIHQVRMGKNISRLLVIGTNRAAEDILRELLKTHSRHLPVAILSPYGTQKKEIFGIPVMGKLNELEGAVEKYKIDEILLSDASEQILNLLSFSEGRFLEFRISPEIFGVFRSNIVPENLAGKTFLTLEHSPLFGWGQFWKRLCDFLFSTILLLLLFPIFAIQKIFRGKNNLFLKEERIGAKGKHFLMNRYATNSNKTFFHDIPNILNIFRGEMSFIGPRPALPKEWETLPSHFKRRMTLRPGMLGEWQIRKLQGFPDNFEQMFADDMKYILHWSFLGDVKILVRSFIKMIQRLAKK